MLPKNQIQSKSENFHWRHPNFENVLFNGNYGMAKQAERTQFQGEQIPQGNEVVWTSHGTRGPTASESPSPSVLSGIVLGALPSDHPVN